MATIAEFRATRPMFDPRSMPVYLLLAIGVAASAILVPALGFSISPNVIGIFSVWPFLAIAGLLLRRVGHPAIATPIEVTAIAYGQGLAFLLALFPLTAISAPFADARLAAADASLGFDWTAYARSIEPIVNFLVLAYKSLIWQPLLIIVLLSIARREDRLWRFATAGTLALLIACLIYPLAPARGAFLFYGMHDYALRFNGPVQFGPVIELIKSGNRAIRAEYFVGFISMPSYHAAAALIFCWAAWPLPRFRWLIICLNAAMMVAAPVIGGHYLVDLLAGFADGAASIAIAIRVSRLVGAATT